MTSAFIEFLQAVKDEKNVNAKLRHLHYRIGERFVQYDAVTCIYQCYYVTRPAKIDHVGTLIYLRNTNLKFSMPHKFPVPNSNHIRFT